MKQLRNYLSNRKADLNIAISNPNISLLEQSSVEEEIELLDGSLEKLKALESPQKEAKLPDNIEAIVKKTARSLMPNKEELKAMEDEDIENGNGLSEEMISLAKLYRGKGIIKVMDFIQEKASA